MAEDRKHALTIIFDGIVAVGPGGPDPQPGPLFAVMPRGVRRQTRYSKTFNDPPSYTSVHFPVMLTRLPLRGREPDHCIDKYRIWYPMRERLTFQFDGEVTPGQLIFDYEKQHDASMKPVDNVSDMREIWPQRARLRPETLRRNPPAEVAAQFFVPKGRVCGCTAVSDPPPASYEPSRTKSIVSKTAVQQVAIRVDAKRVNIAMYSLDTDEKVADLSCVLKGPGLIRVANADPRVIPLMASKEEATESCKADFDFELLYDVLDGIDDGGPFPIPHFEGDRHSLRPCYAAIVDGG